MVGGDGDDNSDNKRKGPKLSRRTPMKSGP